MQPCNKLPSNPVRPWPNHCQVITADNPGQVFCDERRNGDVVTLLRVFGSQDIAFTKLKPSNLAWLSRRLHKIDCSRDVVVFVNVDIVAEPNGDFPFKGMLIDVAEENVGDRIQSTYFPIIWKVDRPGRERVVWAFLFCHASASPVNKRSAFFSRDQNSASRSFVGLGGW